MDIIGMATTIIAQAIISNAGTMRRKILNGIAYTATAMYASCAGQDEVRLEGEKLPPDAWDEE